ncbi:PREDICTED: chymotrypsin-1-like [Wasmannia auropunctata]|uniref:chymotrypsin-1-like n=1 Tax=Wasmannia auropunctata TaxID=64793 RepID=UPI0005F04F4C|nr:PREDICTED: chymotrypsin-1-like [Wasmannia auropunctata]
MHTFACLIFTILVYAIEGAPSSQIIGGSNAAVGKFPYQASLRLNGSHICGGSILDNLNVLTAARCLLRSKCSPDELTVHVGSNLLNESMFVYDVADVSVHQNYDDYFLINDIALVHLKSPIKYNKLVQPINLAKSDEIITGLECTLTGWESKRNGGNMSNSLKVINLLVESQTKCEEIYWKVTNSHICAVARNNSGPCDDDYGSPLVASGSPSVQIGIYSFTNACGNSDPDVYTKVTSFLSWITANLRI